MKFAETDTLTSHVSGVLILKLMETNILWLEDAVQNILIAQHFLNRHSILMMYLILKPRVTDLAVMNSELCLTCSIARFLLFC